MDPYATNTAASTAFQALFSIETYVLLSKVSRTRRRPFSLFACSGRHQRAVLSATFTL